MSVTSIGNISNPVFSAASISSSGFIFCNSNFPRENFNEISKKVMALTRTVLLWSNNMFVTFPVSLSGSNSAHKNMCVSSRYVTTGVVRRQTSGKCYEFSLLPFSARAPACVDVLLNIQRKERVRRLSPSFSRKK